MIEMGNLDTNIGVTLYFFVMAGVDIFLKIKYIEYIF
jgi:hypothetical protein